VGQHPRRLPPHYPQRGHFEKTVFVEDAFHPGQRQPTRFNQDVGRNVVRCQRSGTATGVGGDDLQRAIAEPLGGPFNPRDLASFVDGQESMPAT
jgi:hypothetical protein